MSPGKGSGTKDWVSQLSQLEDERARRRLFVRHIQKRPAALVDRLYEEVVRLSGVDLRRAERVAEASEWLAEKLTDDRARAQSLRARGHILYLTGNYQAALERHRAALVIFEQLGRELDAARVMSNHLQPMIYLGQYENAFALAEKARATFAKHGDQVRLARLDSNVGNILHRLDRFTEALEYYGRAYQVFLQRDLTEDMAVALHNMAICHISLNRFRDALETYRGAREHWQQQDKPLLVAQADYNVAYLHYLRGEYTRAIELYQGTRLLYEKLGEPYHTALCDLDQSEMYLELNLAEEAGDLAQRAYAGFSKLGMNYEAAKALAFQALAANQQGKAERTLEAFDRARQLFRKETNKVWVALIDLYKALILAGMGNDAEARRLAGAALAHFRESNLLSKAALCELMLARLDLKSNDLSGARDRCAAAFQWLEQAQAPAVEFQAHIVFGQVQEALGQPEAAYQTYLNAHQRLEGLRSHLLGEEVKIAFLKDKLSVYESLVCLALARDPSGHGQGQAFDFIERAKSRSLADLIAFQVSLVQPKVERDRKLASHLHQLGEKLTSAYHQARREELRPEQGSAQRIQRLHTESRTYENQLSTALAGLGSLDQDLASLLSAGTVPLDQIRASIPGDALVLEYYQARGTMYACLLGRERLEVVPLAPVGRIREVFRLLQFQLSKFRLGAEYLQRFAQILEAATQAHLRELHCALIAPIRRRLQASHLIVVPHGFLHYLPFHALNDGEQYLMDEFSLSYAPSASVYALCAARETVEHRASLVLGVPDPLAPHILDEAHAVAAILPNARLFLGDQATQELLSRHAPSSRYVHIATHGLFRQDNPMFSSIRLGRSELNLFDLYQLRLSSELVTLSGCGTGLNVVVGGDELLGLVRGLLYAGTQSVLVTLWDVNDESTAEFMKSFYEQIQNVSHKAVAMQHAMKRLRQSHPHPYYWAPFVLIGKFDNT